MKQHDKLGGIVVFLALLIQVPGLAGLRCTAQVQTAAAAVPASAAG